jgi:hypothetical protein
MDYRFITLQLHKCNLKSREGYNFVEKGELEAAEVK